jgi:diguanylate cyclase (GGDEF)-like protein
MAMNSLFRIDVNLFASWFLGMLLIIAFSRLDRKDRLNRLYLILGLIVFSQLAFESATCLMNGLPGEGWRIVSIILHLFLFLVAPSLTYFWFRLVHEFTASEPASRKSRAIWMIFLILNYVVVLTNPIHNLFFTIEPGSNIYARGPLFVVGAFVTYFYLVLAFLHIMKNRGRLLNDEYWLFLLFCLIPILGGTFQVVFYGLLTMWASTAFSLILMYIFLQERMVHLDGLTKSWTRASLDHYLNRRIRLNPHRKFACVYFDIDGLKSINDAYGHLEGDQAIRELIGIVRDCMPIPPILARIGGDEFALILDIVTEEELAQLVAHIQASIDAHNETSKHPYRIDASFGAMVYGEQFLSLEEFSRQIDQLMYAAKAKKKAAFAQLVDLSI